MAWHTTHPTFTSCSVCPCGPTVPPGTPGGHLEATGSGTQKSLPSPCTPRSALATEAEETCWRKSKTLSSIPPNVPAPSGRTPTPAWTRLRGTGSEPLRFHPERNKEKSWFKCQRVNSKKPQLFQVLTVLRLRFMIVLILLSCLYGKYKTTSSSWLSSREATNSTYHRLLLTHYIWFVWSAQKLQYKPTLWRFTSW